MASPGTAAVESPLQLARSLNGRAVAWLRRGCAGIAAALLEKALGIIQEGLEGERELATLQSNLGAACRALGDLPRAERLYHRAVALLERQPEGVERELMHTLGDLAELSLERGDREAAAHLAARALDLLRSAPSRPSARTARPEVARSLHRLADVHRRLGRARSAEELYRHALGIYTACSAQVVRAAVVANDLGAFYHERGDLGAAEALYRRAFAVLRGHPPSFARLGGCLNNLALLHLQRGDWGHAAELYREGRKLARLGGPGRLP